MRTQLLLTLYLPLCPPKHKSILLSDYRKRVRRKMSAGYLTGGLPLAVGDFVVVPVGNRNAEKTGRVTDIFVCSAQDAPYPPEKAKFVLRKSERSAAPEKSET